MNALPNLTIEQRLSSIELKNSQLEARINDLVKDNTSLSNIVFELHEVIQAQNQEIINLTTLVTNNKLSENSNLTNFHDTQENLNSNIVIRGLDISETDKESLDKVFENLRTHIGVQADSDLDPVQINILPATNNSKYIHKRPIIVKLKSIAAKRKFLQIKRAFKHISSQDIEHQQEHNRLLKISEHLTKKNQVLFHKACALREARNPANKYKFVWTNNGQILARKKHKSKVIRIHNLEHINILKNESHD